MRGRNGVMYYYLLAYDNEDLPVVCKILSRNGILPRIHASRYCVISTKAVRIPVASVIKDDAKEDFLIDVQGYARSVTLEDDIKKKLAALRQQVKPKVR